MKDDFDFTITTALLWVAMLCVVVGWVFYEAWR